MPKHKSIRALKYNLRKTILTKGKNSRKASYLYPITFEKTHRSERLKGKTATVEVNKQRPVKAF